MQELFIETFDGVEDAYSPRIEAKTTSSRPELKEASFGSIPFVLPNGVNGQYLNNLKVSLIKIDKDYSHAAATWMTRGGPHYSSPTSGYPTRLIIELLVGGAALGSIDFGPFNSICQVEISFSRQQMPFGSRYFDLADGIAVPAIRVRSAGC